MRFLLSFFVSGALAAAAGLTPLAEPDYTKLIAAHKGKVVLVNFWATYCVPCRAEMPSLVKLHEKLKAKGFQLVTISADEPEDEGRAVMFLDTTKVPAPRYITHEA
jgi:thiol-disulfide isomerase/thioredoxin